MVTLAPGRKVFKSLMGKSRSAALPSNSTNLALGTLLALFQVSIEIT